jgi:hypothetical protein
MKRLIEIIDRHFEFGFIAYMWLNASVLAAIVGRPWLGLIGFATMLPFLVAYLIRVYKKRE